MANQQYIDELGIFKVKFKKVIQRQAKGMSKAACFLEFEDRLSRVTSFRMNNPLTKADFFNISRFIKAVSGKSVPTDALEKAGQSLVLLGLNKYVDLEVLAVITPFEFEDKQTKAMKTMWKTELFIDPKFERKDNVASPSGGPSSDIPF